MRSPDPLADLKRYLPLGARGVKLMSGHGDYHREATTGELDTPAMRAVFHFCEAESIPVLWHVNVHLYGLGFLRVLRDFPRLKVVNPHLGGYLSYAPATVRKLFERHPNLHFDFSFGTQVIYLRRAMEDLSFKREEWRRLILDHPDRFLFGVDMVVSSETALSHANMLFETYRRMLEEEEFDIRYFPARGYARITEDSHHRKGLKGLHLPKEILRKIYWENPMRLYGPP